LTVLYFGCDDDILRTIHPQFELYETNIVLNITLRKMKEIFRGVTRGALRSIKNVLFKTKTPNLLIVGLRIYVI